MPVRYGSIPEEHQKVRLSAGLFDLGHMGRLEIAGKDARDWAQRVISNDYDAMKPGDARYTLLLNEDGTIIDDAIVYKLPETIFLVVNASNRVKVIEWIDAHRDQCDARLSDRSQDLAMIAIQGPQAVRIVSTAVEELDNDWQTMKYYSIAGAKFQGKKAWVARTGYTGEDGFEVYLDAADGPHLWRQLLEVGGNRIAPIGLGARDTLRLEAGMPLYGHEIDSTTDPFEAGLGFAVKLEKAVSFIGQESLRTRAERGPARRLKGFRVEGRRVARQGMKIHAPESSDAVGVITSGAPSPTLGYPIAMGYLSTALPENAVSRLEVDVRGNREPIQVEPLPFYSRTRKKGK